MNKIQTVTLIIEGMTCASCVARVEKSIERAQGVINVSINLASEKAIVTIEKDKFNFLEVKKLIEDAGYYVKNVDPEKDSSNLFTPKPIDKLEKSKKEFLISLIFAIPVFILNMSMMSEELMVIFNLQSHYINYILFILTLGLIFTSGKKFYIAFIKNLAHFSFDMNSLISIGTGSAFIFSSYVTFFPDYLPDKSLSHVYFDTTVVIISLVLLGRWLESKAKFKTNQAINELIKIQPKTALVKVGSTEIEKAIDELKIDDIVIIKPGQNIPTDGIVVNGYSTVDESIVTGESIPVEKSVNSIVKSGSVNKTGYIEFRVTSSAVNSTLGQIIRLMEQSQSYKAPIQKTADKISSVFVPIVLLVAIFSFVFWYFNSNQIDVALINSISVLIIACPCALGLAIPTAIIVGIGVAAKRGILIRDGISLELFNKVSTIFFDKTGTLTTKKLKIESYQLFNKPLEEILGYIIPAEKKSEHPIANAIIEFSKGFNIIEKELEHYETKPGFGIEAIIDGKNILIGNKNFLIDKKIEDLKNLQIKSNSLAEIYVAIENKLEAIFIVSEEIRLEADNVIKKFSDLGIKTIILSGDKFSPTKTVAEKCGVTAFESELLPEDKLNIIKKFQSKGEIVAFVGDGINDAPSITQADIGIAMGTGTDISILSGGVIILNDNLENIFNLKTISKKINQTIKQNLFWAFIYNVIGIPLASFGLLNPIFAAMAMSLSSVSVISNSLRIKRKL